MTEPAPSQQVDRTYVRIGKQKLSYFAGCDYFRLSSHPAIIEAVAGGVRKYGLNTSASRLTTGNHVLYRELERALAAFFDAEDALVTAGGYLTNLIVAQALAGNFSHALIDERAHSSLADATRFLDCPVLRFRHRSSEALAHAVQRCGPRARLIVLTDGMFSHDGSSAPLTEYISVVPRDTTFLVDDAHAAGVLGETGRGALEAAGVKRTGRIIQTLTLSKAFGAYGGGIICGKKFRQQVLDRSKSFVSHTALPLPLACAAIEALKILSHDASFHTRLMTKSQRVRKLGGLAKQGSGPIIPVVPKDSASLRKLRTSLSKQNVFPSFIKYPGGPANGYFRFVISSEHTPRQLDALGHALAAD
jgi:8-amino-7-oxononanoate synthase